MTDQPLFELPFEEILRRTAERTSYPGGGAASAMACASAAPLIAMAGRFTGDAAAEMVVQAEDAMAELAGLAQADADAFGELLCCRSTTDVRWSLRSTNVNCSSTCHSN